MKSLLLCIPYLLLASCLYAQKQYSPELVDRAKQDAAEVFKNNMEYAGAAYMPVYIERLSRLEIKTRPFNEKETYALLSSVMLIEKYNPDLVRENAQTFDPYTFNALKYAFDYSGQSDKIYRVDHTDYIIVIHPKQ